MDYRLEVAAEPGGVRVSVNLKTDGLIHSEKLGPNEVDGNFSGIPDDRRAFTTKAAGQSDEKASCSNAPAPRFVGNVTPFDPRLFHTFKESIAEESN